MDTDGGLDDFVALEMLSRCPSVALSCVTAVSGMAKDTSGTVAVAQRIITAGQPGADVEYGASDVDCVALEPAPAWLQEQRVTLSRMAAGSSSKPPTKSPIKSPTKMLARLLGGTGGGSDAVEAAAAVEGNAKQPGREEQVGGGDEEEVEGGEEEEEEGDEEEEEEPSSAEEESTDDSDREATPAVSLIDDDKEEVEPAAPAARTTTKSQACAIS